MQDPGYRLALEASSLVVLCNYINQTVTRATTIVYVCVKTVPQITKMTAIIEVCVYVYYVVLLSKQHPSLLAHWAGSI